MPVVTTTVLAIGAREMANEKALVNRYEFSHFILLPDLRVDFIFSSRQVFIAGIISYLGR